MPIFKERKTSIERWYNFCSNHFAPHLGSSNEDTEHPLMTEQDMIASPFLSSDLRLNQAIPTEEIVEEIPKSDKIGS